MSSAILPPYASAFATPLVVVADQPTAPCDRRPVPRGRGGPAGSERQPKGIYRIRFGIESTVRRRTQQANCALTRRYARRGCGPPRGRPPAKLKTTLAFVFFEAWPALASWKAPLSLAFGEKAPRPRRAVAARHNDDGVVERGPPGRGAPWRRRCAKAPSGVRLKGPRGFWITAMRPDPDDRLDLGRSEDAWPPDPFLRPAVRGVA